MHNSRIIWKHLNRPFQQAQNHHSRPPKSKVIQVYQTTIFFGQPCILWVHMRHQFFASFRQKVQFAKYSSYSNHKSDLVSDRLPLRTRNSSYSGNAAGFGWKCDLNHVLWGFLMRWLCKHQLIFRKLLGRFVWNFTDIT